MGRHPIWRIKMSKNRGGPAFPTTRDSNCEVCSKGMTLRDYFAAKAMQASLTGTATRAAFFDYNDLAGMSYDIADAMLAEREK